MTRGLGNMRIAGIALMLFCGVLLGVGIHHLIATGTCSSTGYSANYGPVPTCPSGTGWWMAFVFGGVIGCLIGAAMAMSLGLVFGSIFTAIGFGALTIAFDSSAAGGTQTFGAIFGAGFAIVGLIALGGVLAFALRSAAGSRSKAPRAAKPQASPFGTPEPAVALSGGSSPAAQPAPASRAQSPTPADLIPGLQAAAGRSGAKGDAVDELARLAQLHEKGALTDEEFASAKARLLERM